VHLFAWFPLLALLIVVIVLALRKKRDQE